MKRKTKNKSSKKIGNKVPIDAAGWLLTYGVASIASSGISLVYIDVYSIATLNQPINGFGDPQFVSIYLNLFLVFLLILGVSFTRLGIHILQKKIPPNHIRRTISIALIMALLSLLPSGSIMLSFGGFSAIPILYTSLFILDIITIASLVRFFIEKDNDAF